MITNNPQNDFECMCGTQTLYLILQTYVLTKFIVLKYVIYGIITQRQIIIQVKHS